MEIRQFKDADFDEVISLHKICFSVFAFDYEKHMPIYRKFFSPERTLVVDMNCRIIGFGCYSFFDDDFLIEPDVKKNLEKYIAGIDPRQGENLLFEPFSHSF